MTDYYRFIFYLNIPHTFKQVKKTLSSLFLLENTLKLPLLCLNNKINNTPRVDILRADCTETHGLCVCALKSENALLK